jgi:hypothetical protein
MIGNDEAVSPVDDRLIDRLVDGELEPFRRRAVLEQLESEPDGWRRCALAFLEAQAWRSVLRPVADAPPVRDADQTSVRRFHVRLAAAWAAGVLVAFGLGWSGAVAARPRPVPMQPIARVTPEPSRAPVAERARDRTAAAEAPASVASMPGWPDSVRRELERRGFEVQPQTGLAAVRLRDGRSVAVPVEALKVRYVGDRLL